MLAPGDCLTTPVPPESIAKQNAERGGASTPPVAPVAKTQEQKDEPEPRSFLLTLLRCLGAVHT